MVSDLLKAEFQFTDLMAASNVFILMRDEWKININYFAANTAYNIWRLFHTIKVKLVAVFYVY